MSVSSCDCVCVCVCVRHQNGLGSPEWRDIELLSFYLLEGLDTADQLRQASIVNVGTAFVNLATTLEVRPCVGLSV